MANVQTTEEKDAATRKTVAALIELIDGMVHGLLFEELHTQVPHVSLKCHNEGDPPGVFLWHNDRGIPGDIEIGGYVECLQNEGAVAYYHGVIEALHMQKLVRELEPEGGPPWKGEAKRREAFKVFLDERKVKARERTEE
tara:strand:+ start:955 stop:1374 length:420 start_codon:yes stop_codon:yes gene_type:complete